MIWFFVGLWIGALGGVFVMCLMQMARTSDDESRCTGDCNQGRNCTCDKPSN